MLTSLGAVIADVGAGLIPAREWIGRLAIVVPGDRATRWLLLVDALCLGLLAGQHARWPVAVPLALGGGFLALNVLGMLLTDFVLALALFHVGVTGLTAIALRRSRWLGLAAFALVLLLGALT